MKKKILFTTLLTIISFFLIGNSVAFAAVYYAVASGGGGSTCSIGSPCTLSGGLAKLVNGQSHTLYLREGTYSQTVSFANNGQDNTHRHIISGYPGETAIIDGAWTLPGGSYWSPLVSITGSYVTIQDLTIRRSTGKSLQLYTGSYKTALRIKSEYAYENGIVIWKADHCLIDDCTSYYDCYERVLGDLHKDGNWASCVSIFRGSNNSTIQDTTVSYCSGESLSMYTYSEGGNTYNTIQDSTVYHSGPPALYISNCRNCTAQRNLLYANTQLSGSNIGIYMQDEYGSYMNSDNKIINNFVKGFNRNYYWGGSGHSGTGLQNTVIAGNTFVNAKSTANIKIDSGNHSGSSIKNNIFLQEDSIPVMVIASGSGLGFGYNNYDDASGNVDNDAKGPSDLYGSNPKLAKTGSTADGQLTAKWFMLESDSPCIGAGTIVTELSEDYWHTSRDQGSFQDIGGHEYVKVGDQPLPVPSPPVNLRIAGY